MAVPTLGYWNLRFNTEPIRQILHYAGIQFEDKRYNFGATPETFRDEWMVDKFNLGLDFPNLPYFISGDLKITQSSAVLRHVARLAKLVGETEQEQATTDMLEQQAVDLRTALTGFCYNVDKFEDLKAEFLKTQPDRLKQWSDYLGNKKYLLGDKLTYVDFLLADVLDIHRKFEPTVFSAYANLAAHIERVHQLAGVKEYNATAAHQIPYNAPVAKWTGA